MDKETELVKTKWGTFEVFTDDHIGSIMRSGVHYERDLIAVILNKTQNRRKDAIDVGAFIGTHTLAFSRAFRNVYAFEPNPVSFELLQANVKRNKKKNVSLFNMAVGAVNGTVNLVTPDNENIGHTQAAAIDGLPNFEAPLVRLDNVRLLRGIVPGLIKIDVEGYEQPVIRGAFKLIREHRPFVWMERTTHRQDLGDTSPFDMLLTDLEYTQVIRYSKIYLLAP